MTDQKPLDAPWPTRMTRIVESAQHVATAMDTVRAAITDASQALGHLHAVMQDAGLIPDDQADIGRHRDDAVQRLAGALDIPPELITGSPGVNHWTAWAMTADTQTIPTITEEPWTSTTPSMTPRTSTPAAPAATTQEAPPVRVHQGAPANASGADAAEDDQNGLCDGCGRTDRPVTATDDGRAQACPQCLPQANYWINQRCPDCDHPWAYAGRLTGCAMPVKPGTTTPAEHGEDAHRCNCPTLPPPPAEQDPAPQPHPEQPSTSG